MEESHRSGVFSFVLAAVSSPGCSSPLSERRLVLRKLWRTIQHLPPLRQAGARAALMQMLVELRMGVSAAEAATMHFESWDDVAHNEVLDMNSTPTMLDWQRLYDPEHRFD